MRVASLAAAVGVWMISAGVANAQGVIPVPGKIEVEQYDSFYDLTTGNAGGACRSNDVDLSPIWDPPDSQTTCLLSQTEHGEWIGFTMNVAQSDTYVLSIRVAHPGIGGTFHVEIDDVDVTGQMRVPDTGNWVFFQTLRKHGISLTAGLHTLKLKMDTESATTGAVGSFNYLALTRSVPYTGTAPAVPGRIEIEDFDVNPNGGSGEAFAYHDTNSANLGGAYRSNEGVDITPTNDSSGNYNIAWTEKGEWLGYTVNATETGLYTLSLRLSHPGSGGTLHLEVDGTNVTGTIQVPDTGGWSTWQNVTSSNFHMDAGVHVLYLVADSVSPGTGAAANINYFTLVDPPADYSPPSTASNITWIDMVNVTAGDSVLQKTSGCDGCDDAGARSQEEIPEGNGYIEFTVGETNTIWYAGLSNGNTDTSFADIDFAFRFNGAGVADVKENGVYKGGDTPYAVGDVFRVAVVDGLVYYRRNGALLYISQITPTYPLLLDTSLTTAGATIHDARVVLTGLQGLEVPSDGYNGGHFEEMGVPHGRTKSGLKPSIPSFVPAQKGSFEFPDPYFTTAARLTDPSDCGVERSDCLWYVGYSYWRRMNNHVNRPSIYILLSLKPGDSPGSGGEGPTIFRYNKGNGDVARMPMPLFPESDPDPERALLRREDAEMWYFSAQPAKPTMFYAFRKTDTKLKRFQFDVDPNTDTQTGYASQIDVALDITLCPHDNVPLPCPADDAYFDHPHSSDDDLVHIATVVRRAGEVSVGCVVRDQKKPLGDPEEYRFFYPETGHGLDECALDKSGRWLIVNEPLPPPDSAPDDQVVIDLQDNNRTSFFRDRAGAHTAHADLGYGYSVGPDNFYQPDTTFHNPTTIFKLPDGPRRINDDQGNPTLGDRAQLVHYNSASAINDANHVSHTNAEPPPIAPEQQYACGSFATSGDNRDEIVCFKLPDQHDPLHVLVVAPVMTDRDSVTAGDGAAGPIQGTQGTIPNAYARFPKGNLDVTGEYFVWTTNVYGTENRLDAFIVRVPKEKLLKH